MPFIAIAAIAVRPIDLAIFATLGLLWIGGAMFIVALYRWIRRYEREQAQRPAVVPRSAVTR